MSLFTSQKPPTASWYALLSIESAIVHGSLVESTPGQAPRILYTTKSFFSYQKDLKHEHYIRAMIASVMEVCMQLQNEGARAHQKATEKVVCVFGAPWYVSHTRTVSVSKSEPFLVRETTIKDLVVGEKKAFQESLKKQSHSSPSEELVALGSEIIETTLLETKLNGYVSHEPIGKKARQIDLTVALGLLPKEVLVKTQEVIEKAFQAHDISFHSSALAAFRALHELFAKEPQFVYVSVEGEVTEVSIVSSGRSFESNVFPLGDMELIRSIAQARHTTVDEAKSILSLYFEKKTQPSKAQEIETLITTIQAKWLEQFKKTVHEVTGGKPMPIHVYLLSSGGAWITPIFQKAAQFQSLTLRRGELTVVTLSPTHFESYCTFPKNTPYEMRVALDAIFLHCCIGG